MDFVTVRSFNDNFEQDVSINARKRVIKEGTTRSGAVSSGTSQNPLAEVHVSGRGGVLL